MRSLVVRFLDSEGPGILGEILRQKGYQVTYHDAYKEGLHLIPQAHLAFDLIILMGGPQSVTDESLKKFFKPYMNLVRNTLATQGKKMIGICLGSQIIAQALGGEVKKGDKGAEVGFGELEIVSPEDKIFQDLNNTKSILGFHLHEDVFTLPGSAKLLLSSEKYTNQLFSIQDRIYGFQVHLEPTWDMLQVWKDVHMEFMAKANVSFTHDWKDHQESMAENSRLIFKRIIEG
ncbi:MAG: type 1 glutamine amidotransferase [Leptospira sp.]|nr:type 1 glutamine amidotransferase [Leptospira sp.]